MKRYFNESDLQLFTLSDLVGRTVEIRHFVDLTQQADSTCHITVAHDTNTGEVFILNVSWTPEVQDART